MCKILAVLVALLALTNGQVINSCLRNPGTLPQSASVEGCNSSPCAFRNGRPLNIHMSFRAPRHLNHMLTLVTSYFNLGNAILPTQVDLGASANTCNHLTNRRCPVNQGDLVNYTLRMNITGVPVMHIIPFEFRVVDHGPMLCVMVPIRAEG